MRPAAKGISTNTFSCPCLYAATDTDRDIDAGTDRDRDVDTDTYIDGDMKTYV